MLKPPEKYWQLLELALADFDVISQDPNYDINMMVYHDGATKRKCVVCLAGSVMARTLQADRTKMYSTYNFRSWSKALNNISNIALGSRPDFFPKEHEEAFWKFQEPLQDKPYDADPAHWRAHMSRVVEWLKERDL